MINLLALVLPVLVEGLVVKQTTTEDTTSQSDEVLIATHAEERRSELAKIVGCVTFTILSTIGVAGNSLVIYAIFTDPAVQTKNQLSNMGILNLAFTDLMTMTLVGIPAAVCIVFDEYPLGTVFCKMWAVFNVTGIVATMNLLMLISVDRFIAVGWSLHYPQWVTYNRLRLACIYIWCSVFLCVLAWSFFSCDYDFWAGICDFTWHLFGPKVPAAFWYGLFCTVFLCLVPSGAILACNVGIIRMSREKGRVGKLEEPKKVFYIKPGAPLASSLSKAQIPKEQTSSKVNARILKTMVIVIVSYFVLTFPVAIIRVLKLLTGPEGLAQHIPGWLTLTCTFLQFSASIVNPMIYGLFRKDFRESYGRVFKKLRKTILGQH